MVAGVIRQDVASLPRRRWLNGGMSYDSGVPERPVYASAWMRLLQAVGADPNWAAWWRRTGAVVLELQPVQTRHGPGRPRVRRGITEVRVECALDGSRLDDGNRARLVTAAAQDLLLMLDVTRQQLDLPPLPPLPTVEAVPDEVPDRRPAGRAGFAALPQDQEEIIRTMVEVLGVPREQALAIVSAPAGGQAPTAKPGRV
jgi:hypothetical protein